jgi:hypothetical protein
MSEPSPNTPAIRQMVIGAALFLAPGAIFGLVFFRHGIYQELSLVIGASALIAVAAGTPALSRWMRRRWGPDAR